MATKIPAVKGTRDLYPELLAPLRRIFDVWRSISLRHGFEEFEGPTLEMLDLYREKSGEELVGQLYRLTDSGGRELALRPEMTPTLARMVAARLSTLAKPIKWFCIPTLFRGENVQRGRLREFYQWNVDVIGSESPAADAEVILVGVEALRELGLKAEDFVVRVSSRRLMAALLESAGVPETRRPAAYALLDRHDALGADEFRRRWDGEFGEGLRAEALQELMGCRSIDEVAGSVGGRGPGAAAALEELRGLWGVLCNFGITEFCTFDLGVVRGLAYYTGVVFEFHDRARAERAICGGGRYDDLLGKLGKRPEPAVGFGMGDVVLALMLQERGLLAVGERRGRIAVLDAQPEFRPTVLTVVAALRRAGIEAVFAYEPMSLQKQLRWADRQGAAVAILLGVSPGLARIRDMVGGQERDVLETDLLSHPRSVLEGRP